MNKYNSPGVYVNETTSQAQPITGVGTTTAAFIGLIKEPVIIPTSPLIREEYINKEVTPEQDLFQLDYYPVSECSFTIKIIKKINDKQPPDEYIDKQAKVVNDVANQKSFVKLGNKANEGDTVMAIYYLLATKQQNKLINVGNEQKPDFELTNDSDLANLIRLDDHFSIRVDGTPIEKIPSAPQSGGALSDNQVPTYEVKKEDTKIKVIIKPCPKKDQDVRVDYAVGFATKNITEAEDVKLCQSFSDFKEYFGDFSTSCGQKHLAHAVSGFFENGGSRCYVTYVADIADIATVLKSLQAFDEIALIAIPGIHDDSARNAIITHCRDTRYRFAIFDYPYDSGGNIKGIRPEVDSSLAAIYHPRIKVFDPATKAMCPEGDGLIYVPPSGHIAGIYARVDRERGVHKAPANEVVRGAVDVERRISRSEQDELNPQGINCIRFINDSIRVWGARTLSEGTDDRYINVRRTMLFLAESIDKGTQWAVFEPNNPGLWQQIVRNVSDFLLVQWRAGALFGTTPQEAFYVQCDEETNPPSLRAQGQLNAKVGVAIVRPAEFVVFTLSQTTLPAGS